MCTHIHEIFHSVPLLSTQNGGTALFYASWKGHLEVVRLLLQAGAVDTPENVCYKKIEKRKLNKF